MPTEAGAWVIRNLVSPVVKLLFRPGLEGAQNLPENGPYLLVSNHNAGMGAAELASIAAVWLEHFGLAPRAVEAWSGLVKFRDVSHFFRTFPIENPKFTG